MKAVFVGMGPNRACWKRGIAVGTSSFSGKRFLIFPHPSGINAWWNDPENFPRARASLVSFLEINL